MPNVEGVSPFSLVAMLSLANVSSLQLLSNEGEDLWRPQVELLASYNEMLMGIEVGRCTEFASMGISRQWNLLT